MNWVVKVSKLCNLRCRYCYEWNELHRTERMGLSEWRRLLGAIRLYHERRTAEVGEPFTTTIIWHGGEPLMLPLSYLRSVLDLQHEILGALLEDGAVVNGMQTNLYRITDEQIELLKAEKIELGVSCDVVGGPLSNAKKARYSGCALDSGTSFPATRAISSRTVL